MLSEVVIVKSPDSFKRLTKSANLASSAMWVPLCAEALHCVVQRGLPFQIPQWLLGPEEMKRIYKEARDLAGAWFGMLKRPPDCHGTDLGKVSQPDLLPWFREAVFAARLILRLIDDHGLAHLVLCSSFVRPCEWWQTSDISHDVFDGVARYVAEARGVQVTIIPLPGLPQKRSNPTALGILKRIYAAMPGFVQAAWRAFKHRWKGAPENRLVARAWHEIIGGFKDANLRIVTMGQYQDFLNLIPLGHLLEQQAGIDLLRVHLGTGSVDFARLADHGDLARFFPCDFRYGCLLDDTPTAAGQAWKTDKASATDVVIDVEQVKGNAELSEAAKAVLCTPHLSFQWRPIVEDYLPALERAVAAGETFFSAVRPDLLIVSSTKTGRDRALVETARRRGLRSATYLHGGPVCLFTDLDVEDFNTDYLFVANELRKQGFLEHLHKLEDQIKILGNLDRDFLPSSTFGKGQAAPSQSQSSSRKTVLILTVRDHLGFCSANDMMAWLSTFNVMVDLARDMQDVHFVFKPHPRGDYYSVYEGVLTDIPNVTYARQSRLEDWLGQADVVVTLNAMTTAFSIALQWRKPTLFVSTSLGHYPTPPYVMAEITEPLLVTTDSQLGTKLQKALTESSFREGLIEQGDAIIDRFNLARGSPSTTTMAAIKEIVRNARDRQGVTSAA